MEKVVFGVRNLDIPCRVGFALLKHPVAMFFADYGSHVGSCLPIFKSTRHIHKDVENKNGVWVYRILTDLTAEGYEAAVSENESAASDAVKISFPALSIVYSVSDFSHHLFDVLSRRYGVWLLITAAAQCTVVQVEAATGRIIRTDERSRRDFFAVKAHGW